MLTPTNLKITVASHVLILTCRSMDANPLYPPSPPAAGPLIPGFASI